jgi:hypothetical protein
MAVFGPVKLVAVTSLRHYRIYRLQPGQGFEAATGYARAFLDEMLAEYS